MAIVMIMHSNIPYSHMSKIALYPDALKNVFLFFSLKSTLSRCLGDFDNEMYDIDDILMLFSHCADGIDISAHHR